MNILLSLISGIIGATIILFTIPSPEVQLVNNLGSATTSVSYLPTILPIATSTVVHPNDFGTTSETGDRRWGRAQFDYATTITQDIYDELKIGRAATTTITEGTITTTDLTITGTCTGCSNDVKIKGDLPLEGDLYVNGGDINLGTGKTATGTLSGEYGLIGFGTTSPYGQVSIEAVQGVVGSSTPIFVIGDSGSSSPILTVDSRAGYIGISTDTPMAQFAIEANTKDGDDFYVFAVGSTGSDTPSILVQSNTGKVAVGTKKFSGNAALQVGITDTTTTFLSSVSTLTVHNESSTNNTSTIIAGRTTDGTGALAAVGRLGWQIEDHTSLSVNTDFAVSTILNGTEGEVFRVEDDGDFGIGTSTIGAGQQFAVKGAGLFKGGLYVQATTTTSSLIATSTLEVRGTATTTIGGTIAIDLAAGTSTIAGNLEITKSLRVNGAIYTNIASSTNTGTTTLIGDCSLGPKISFVLDKDARFVRKNCFGGQTQMMFIDNPPHQVGGEDHQISWEGSDGVESEAASNTLKFSKGTSTVGYITQGATNICTVIYATSSDNISIYGILECGDAGYIYR